MLEGGEEESDCVEPGIGTSKIAKAQRYAKRGATLYTFTKLLFLCADVPATVRIALPASGMKSFQGIFRLKFC